jgi:hypothetical protein
MPITTWAQALTLSFQSLFYGLVQYLPNLLLAVIIFVIGWLIGAGLARVIAQVVNALRVDQALRAAGVEGVLERAGFKMNAGAFLGMLVKWFVIVLFLVAALQMLGLTQVNEFLTAVVLGYLPRVIVAVLILLAAAVIAESLQHLVSGSARAAGIASANFLGTVTRWAIWIFALLAALDQLGVTPFIQTLFTGIVVALALAFGLSFGLGGQAVAGRYLERIEKEMK